MKFESLHPADQIVMIMDRIYMNGLTTTSGGNISVLDADGSIWITPGSVDKGALKRRDIVRVLPDGSVEGIHKPSIELPIHKKAYEARSDVRAVLHAHPPALVAFSIVRRIPDIRLVPNARLVCGEVGSAPYALPGSRELADGVAGAFALGFDCVLLENHGAAAAGPDLFRAFMALETLEFCARLEIEARRLGEPQSLTEEQIGQLTSKQKIRLQEFVPERRTGEEGRARREMCRLIRRACDRQLFTSTQGTFSQRLSGGRFLITPYMADRKYLEPEDLVLVDGLSAEEGKQPSRSAPLHRHIYDRQMHVNSVIVAHPPYIMAFAVTGRPFDSHTIPESYVMLRGVPALPFGSSFMEPEKTAGIFNRGTPVALVRNDCAIVTGSSLLNAFDRLEVAEYSAKAVIAAQGLGRIAEINGGQIEEIDRAFSV